MMEKIIAAGGIVENKDSKILFMYRRGKWDLPKGKWDDGETIEECAVREVEEETGLINLQRKNLIDKTIHNYSENGKDVEKETYWYAMKVEGEQKLVAQSEEDIEEIRWVDPAVWVEAEKTVYGSIRDVILEGLKP